VEYKTSGSIGGSNGVLSCSGVVRCCCCVKVKRSDDGGWWWCFGGLACCASYVALRQGSLVSSTKVQSPSLDITTRPHWLLKSRGIEIDTWFVTWRLVSLMPLPFSCQINTHYTSTSLTQHVFAIHADIYSQVRL
jgi:hypothetical protein